MSWTDQLPALERALALGTRRAPLALPAPFEAEEGGPLKLLAAMAVRERCSLPPPPAAWADTPDVAQDRALYVSDPVRRMLRRSFARKGRSHADGAVPEASRVRVMLALRASGLALHPFDLAALRVLLPAAASTGLPGSDEATWREAPLPERVTRISRLHAAEPERARELLTGCLGSETAPTRAKLLSALSASLTPQDAPLLQSCLSDRARSVRERVEGMLAQLPGTTQYEARLGLAVERLVVRPSGILRRSKLNVDVPRQLRDGALSAWYADTFSGLAPAQLAAGVDLPVADMITRLDDPLLAQVLAVELAASGALAAVNALAVRFAGALLPALASLPAQTAARLDSEARRTLFAAAVQPDEWRNTPRAMHRCGHAMVALQMPLPANASRVLFASSAWRHFLDGNDKQRNDVLEAGVAEIAVALCDDDARPTLHAQLRQSSQHGRGFKALELCQLLDALQGLDH